jgi:hypothetical protein
MGFDAYDQLAELVEALRNEPNESLVRAHRQAQRLIEAQMAARPINLDALRRALMAQAALSMTWVLRVDLTLDMARRTTCQHPGCNKGMSPVAGSKFCAEHEPLCFDVEPVTERTPETTEGSLDAN